MSNKSNNKSSEIKSKIKQDKNQMLSGNGNNEKKLGIKQNKY